MLTLMFQVITDMVDIQSQVATISPVQSLGKLIEMGAGAVLVVGTLAVLFYLLLGGLNWITAGGDKGKIESARNRITQSIIGLLVLVGTVAISLFISSLLGINLLKPEFENNI